MARHNLRSSRRMGFESLEGRQLMAANVMGNVLAGVNAAGDLVLTGDNNQNNLQIIQVQQNGQPVAGRFFIAPQDGTRLNGQSTGQFFSNVTHDMKINLAGGNDRLTLGDGSSNNNFVVPNDLVISMGDGADVVAIDRISVRDDASITTGDGNDSVSFKGTVGALAGIDNGANDLSIDTGLRADNVHLENLFVRRNLVVNTGTDNFTDTVDFLFGNIGNNTNISTGEGSDIVNISDVGFNNDLTILTGGGSDAVSISNSEVDELFASLGAGTDTLKLKDTFGNRATLNGGGAEVDTLTRINSPFSDFFQASNF